MKEKSYLQAVSESIEFGDTQFWIAVNKNGRNVKEVVRSLCGNFYNFNDNIYHMTWGAWVYYGPLDLTELIEK